MKETQWGGKRDGAGRKAQSIKLTAAECTELWDLLVVNGLADVVHQDMPVSDALKKIRSLNQGRF